MSAFVHNAAFFASLHNAISMNKDARQSFVWALGLSHGPAHSSLDSHRHVREQHEEAYFWDYCRALQAAECYAVDYRYPKGPRSAVTLPESAPPFSAKTDCSLVAIYKRLQSIDYQCAEGDTHESAEHGPTLSKLRMIRECIANQIISNLPQYRSAEW